MADGRDHGTSSVATASSSSVEPCANNANVSDSEDDEPVFGMAALKRGLELSKLRMLAAAASPHESPLHNRDNLDNGTHSDSDSTETDDSENELHSPLDYEHFAMIYYTLACAGDAGVAVKELQDMYEQVVEPQHIQLLLDSMVHIGAASQDLAGNYILSGPSPQSLPQGFRADHRFGADSPCPTTHACGGSATSVNPDAIREVSQDSVADSADHHGLTDAEAVMQMPLHMRRPRRYHFKIPLQQHHLPGYCYTHDELREMIPIIVWQLSIDNAAVHIGHVSSRVAYWAENDGRIHPTDHYVHVVGRELISDSVLELAADNQHLQLCSSEADSAKRSIEDGATVNKVSLQSCPQVPIAISSTTTYVDSTASTTFPVQESRGHCHQPCTERSESAEPYAQTPSIDFDSLQPIGLVAEAESTLDLGFSSRPKKKNRRPLKARCTFTGD